ncbi:serine/threonine protein kinase [Ktedonobacteria bacterium brp13]|nr:serine/threonine protein kinase [Ktedonobacteria bacterium brp13]
MLYTLSRYYLTTHIDRRASHDIYLSYPVGEPEHKVILKLYDPACRVPGTSVEDFFIMARRFKQLSHPHLVPIIDIGLEEGKPYIVSDYIANGSLRQQLEHQPVRRLNLDEALRITRNIGTAIAYAHAHTIIHKDIRPENILFNEHGEALLGDFVLGEIIQEHGIQHQLDARTLSYMAPEQLNGISTPKSDQYALGCLLYELLTGTLPFGAGTGSLLDQQLTTEPKPPSAMVSGIPKALETTILQALSRQQSERYPDIDTFLNSLQTASRPAPPVFPFAHVLSQTSIADAPEHENADDGENKAINAVDDHVTELDTAADDTPSASDDQDDPFAYISTPTAAEQPEEQVLNLNAMQYPNAEALLLPAGPVQPGQLAVVSQPSLFGTATPPPPPPPQNSPGYTLQPPSRRKANSFLLIALVSIILASILSTSFNSTILALTATLPATAGALAHKQTGTPGQPQVTPTATTKPTTSGSKKNHGSSKSSAKGSKSTSIGGARGSSNQSTGTSGGGQPGTTSNPGTNPNPTPTHQPAPPPPPTPILTLNASGGGSYDPTGGVNLSNGGSIDWVHWGYGGGYNVDSKSGATQYIGPVSWNTGIRSDTDQSNDFSWYNGTPHGSVSGITSGTDIPGTASFSVRSDPTPHTLTLYLGAYRAKGTLVISFRGTTVYTSSFDMSHDPTNAGDNTVYVIHYSSTVTSNIDISYSMTVAGGGANCVILEAATIS